MEILGKLIHYLVAYCYCVKLEGHPRLVTTGGFFPPKPPNGHITSWYSLSPTLPTTTAPMFFKLGYTDLDPNVK